MTGKSTSLRQKSKTCIARHRSQYLYDTIIKYTSDVQQAYTKTAGGYPPAALFFTIIMQKDSLSYKAFPSAD